MSGRSGITLRHPSGAKVRCAAHKRYAVAAVLPAEHFAGVPRMKVVLRTDDAHTLTTKGRRLATKMGRDLHAFRLTDGTYLGILYATGPVPR